ncbi:MAG: hypothetical protein ISS82_03030 [Nanoarchaeota archaeon]|nr:hypothetical protein [Nanoarchaeota archaeon]
MDINDLNPKTGFCKWYDINPCYTCNSNDECIYLSPGRNCNVNGKIPQIRIKIMENEGLDMIAKEDCE